MAKAAHPATGKNIAHLVYGLCAIIIAVFALSNVLVLRTTGGVAEADNHHINIGGIAAPGNEGQAQTGAGTAQDLPP